MKIEHIAISRFNVAEVVKEINKRVEGRNCHGVFFVPTSPLKGTLEIYTTPILNRQEKPKEAVKKRSKYRGVCWDKGLGKWRTRLMVGGKRISLGVYYCEKQAALAYDEAIKFYKQDERKLNFKGRK